MRRLKHTPAPPSKKHMEALRRAMPAAYNIAFDTGLSGPTYPCDEGIWLQSYWHGDAYWKQLKAENRWSRAVERAKQHLSGDDQTKEPWYGISSERTAFEEALAFVTTYLPALGKLMSGEGNR